MTTQPAVPGPDRVGQARQDAVELAGLVRDVGPDAIAQYLAGLDATRKDSLLVALACAVDVDRTSRQWWGWLDDPTPAPRSEPLGVRPVPTVEEVRRFARTQGLSDDQVWRAVVDLHATPRVSAVTAPVAGPAGAA